MKGAARVIAAALALSVGIPATAQAPGGAATKSDLVELGDGAVAFVPKSLRGGATAPVVVLLHGAGGNPTAMIRIFRAEAERQGVALLGIKSRAGSWDMIEALRTLPEGAGDEPITPVTNIDEPRIRAAMARLSRCLPTDPAHMALAGFSDGASYALTVGPAHPDQYRTVLAFSPGLALLTADPDPKQRVFISHGRKDSILPFASRESQLVPGLRAAGMNVAFRPFDGDHLIPPEIVREAFAYFLKDLPPPTPSTNPRRGCGG